MIRKPSIEPTPRNGQANSLRHARPDPAAIDRLVCQGLQAHMAELEEAGFELNWPVVRGKRSGERVVLEIDSPYFFLNERVSGAFKQTSAAKRVRPTKAGKRSILGYGERFAAAMRDPDSKTVDVLLYSDGLLILYRDSMSQKESMECLSALPMNPEARADFVANTLKAAASHMERYLVRERKPTTIQLHRDVTNRQDLARFLAQRLGGPCGGGFALDAEVERVAGDPALAARINREGSVKQLEYLLRIVGEERTRGIVSRCARTSRRGRRAPAA